MRDANKLQGVAVFREYQFDWAERIALDALFDARRMGAEVRNYTRLKTIEQIESNKCWRLSLCSVEEDGIRNDKPHHETAKVTADLVLNLAGAWVDEIIKKTNTKIASKCSGLKGIHIAVQLPAEFAEWGVFAFNSIREPLYCLPWHGMHYIGLTRIPFEGDAAGVNATDQEIDWMISETNRCLPKIAIRRSDILFTWAGVNPLTSDPESPLGSREIKIHDLANDGLPGILALTGGPIMTHQRIAKRLVNKISRHLSPSGGT